jgi:photosynthetic reaction center cytochrome c subunit
LLLRLVRYAETPLGRNPTQIDYADYRDVNGVKVPFRWTLARPGNRFTIQIEQTQQNVPVEDAKFAPPPPPPAATKPATP